MKLAVFGANGATGRLLTRLALNEDHDVVAFTRHPDAFPIADRRVEVVGGDVHDRAAVASAIEGSDAVVSTLGVPFSKGAVTVYSEGVAAIMAGMQAAGVKRFSCVSSSAELGRTLYEDVRRMEAMVSGSDLLWTIVRPSGLHDAPAVSDYGIAIDYIGHRFTSRIDLADCLLRQALGDTYVRSTIAVATTSAHPSMLKLIWREGIRKKS
jgi:uncharacterized protein YbjT (DUF2867 family)